MQLREMNDASLKIVLSIQPEFLCTKIFLFVFALYVCMCLPESLAENTDLVQKDIHMVMHTNINICTCLCIELYMQQYYDAARQTMIPVEDVCMCTQA
jgi:hypothetical protein